jgi:glucose-1-phosphate thymidylyltransferase
MRYINKEQLLKLAEPLRKNGYGQYLINRIKGENEVY